MSAAKPAARSPPGFAYNQGMRVMLILLPFLLGGCALCDCVWNPVPDEAYVIARSEVPGECEIRAYSMVGARARFKRLYAVLHERFGEPNVHRVRPDDSRYFRPKVFCRWEQTDDHLGADLYYENWNRHNDPELRKDKIDVFVSIRDFHAERERNERIILKWFGEEILKDCLKKDGNFVD